MFSKYMAKMELKDKVVKILEDLKVEEIIIIDTSKTSSLADYVIVGSGRSGKHVESTIENLRLALKNEELTDGLINGKSQDGWVLYDLGNIIVHLFTPEIREIYKLEDLYAPKAKTIKKATEIKEKIKKITKEKPLTKKTTIKATATKKVVVKKTPAKKVATKKATKKVEE